MSKMAPAEERLSHAFDAASRWPAELRSLTPRAAALMGARLGESPPVVWPHHLSAARQGMLAGHGATLAAWIAVRQAAAATPLVVGIAGGQGSGKSTLAGLSAALLEREYGRRVAVLSLDDLYLPRAERARLAEKVHPLFRTRGVPGTHDPEFGGQLLDRLTGRVPESSEVALPRFDKATDDRRAPADWTAVMAPVDVVLFEGWCVGATPQPDADLAEPINALEREEDPDGRWRRAVNAALARGYADLFARLDALVMLRLPDFEAALQFREAQEAELRHTSGSGSRAMDPAAVVRFVAHYERLTRHMLRDMPGDADLVLALDAGHAVTDVATGNAGRRFSKHSAH